MARHCARPGCAELAIATLAYDYGSSTVWMEHLSDDAHPMTHDLCARHADNMTVPMGWLLQDRRTPVHPIFKAKTLAS